MKRYSMVLKGWSASDKPDEGMAILRLRGVERLSEPYTYVLDLVAKHPRIEGHAVVFQYYSVECKFSDAAGKPQSRFFGGHVSKFQNLGSIGRFTHYQMTLRPWLWLLGLRRNMRIFQPEMMIDDLPCTQPNIIKTIFDEYKMVQGEKFAPFPQSKRVREYCLQYRESDLDFVSRLMENEGYAYYFEHGEKHVKLIPAKGEKGFKPAKPKRELIIPSQAGGDFRHNELEDHQQRTEIINSRSYILDWDPLHPVLEGLGDRARGMAHRTEGFAAEFFDSMEFPSGYVSGEGEPDTRKMVLDNESAEAAAFLKPGAYSEFDALTDWPNVRAGDNYELKGHPALSGDHVVVATHIQLLHSGYESWVGDNKSTKRELSQALQDPARLDPQFHMSNSHNCRMTSVQKNNANLQPRAKTPKPKVFGPQTAIVVGPKEQEIYADKHGRIKVKFHWDRDPSEKSKGKDEIRSCWIRVAQIWAGKGWGAQFIPRVGHEVVVNFMDGDPDRPLVTGSVYNAANPPPYNPKEHPTSSGIKTRSSKKGGPQNFNEIKFEDKKGHEVLSLHAEKDMSTSVENDQGTSVGHDQGTSVKNNRFVTVDKNETVHIKVDRFKNIDGNEINKHKLHRHTTVTKTDTLNVTQNRFKNITLAEVSTYKEKFSTVSATELNKIGDQYNKIGNQISTIEHSRAASVGGDDKTSVTGNQTNVVNGDRLDGVQKMFKVAAQGGIRMSTAGNFDVFAGANINQTCIESNSTVLGNNSSGYIGISSGTTIGMARSTQVGMKIDNSLSMSMENAIGISISNFLGLKLETCIALGIEQKPISMYDSALACFKPGGGGGAGAGASSFAAGAALGAALVGIGFAAYDIYNTFEQYKGAEEGLKEAMQDAADAGFPELAGKLSALIADSQFRRNQGEAALNLAGGLATANPLLVAKGVQMRVQGSPESAPAVPAGQSHWGMESDVAQQSMAEPPADPSPPQKPFVETDQGDNPVCVEGGPEAMPEAPQTSVPH